MSLFAMQTSLTCMRLCRDVHRPRASSLQKRLNLKLVMYLGERRKLLRVRNDRSGFWGMEGGCGILLQDLFNQGCFYIPPQREKKVEKTGNEDVESL